MPFVDPVINAVSFCIDMTEARAIYLKWLAPLKENKGKSDEMVGDKENIVL
jgi:hypothetical protein